MNSDVIVHYHASQEITYTDRMCLMGLWDSHFQNFLADTLPTGLEQFNTFSFLRECVNQLPWTFGISYIPSKLQFLPDLGCALLLIAAPCQPMCGKNNSDLVANTMPS
jgi:hypothetical protein